jgi:excinuclease ABC subunit C
LNRNLGGGGPGAFDVFVVSCYREEEEELKMDKPLPHAPGIYLFKDALDRVIYIGKAKDLDKRVKSYFSKQKTDWKVQALLAEHATIDYILTKNETEALLLEAQLVHDHQPKFNVLLKEGQPFVYLLFTEPGKSGLSQIELVRNKEKKGHYFGPFLHKQQARKVYRYLLETFKLNLCNKKVENGCLDYHLGRCAGNCRSDFDHEAYNFRLQLAQNALKKDHQGLLNALQEKMEYYSKRLEFEKAQHLQEYLENLDIILHTLETKFSETKYQYEIKRKTVPNTLNNLSSDDVPVQLQQQLGLGSPIYVIDCFDISHFQSNELVGSCVRFVRGIPEPSKFRRFKIRTLTHQNDYAALQEIVSRRYKYYQQGVDDTESDLPDLVLIDGGKGQLSAVQAVISEVPCVGLAKREEMLFGLNHPEGRKLDVHHPGDKLLIAMRDYAHHFAINYHRLRRNRDFKR